MTIKCRPIVKFAGGKTRLLPEILPRIPKRFGTYFEPFVGGGAVFFKMVEEGLLGKNGAILADTNSRLLRTYRAIKKDPEGVIAKLKRMKNEETFFYKQRSRLIDDADEDTVAAWFIYLNKTGFNGLYRVNSQDEFNVPFGRYKNPNICDVETIRNASIAFTRALSIEVASFEKTMGRATKGDFIYCDPPYIPLSETSNFTTYSKGGFGWEEHVRLYECALDAKKRGVKVLLSNSSHPEIRELYQKAFKVEEVFAPRSINSKGEGRAPIAEFLISS